MGEEEGKYIIRKENESDTFNKVVDYLDPDIGNILSRLSTYNKSIIEEIRLRTGKPLMVCMKGTDFYIGKNGTISANENDSFIIGGDNIFQTFQLLSNYSIYAIEEELKNGFLTIRGGHRIGVSGKAIYGQKGLETIKDISSLNIRIAREKIGVSDSVMRYILKKPNTIYNTLVVSPPQCGKTTLIRDIVRNLSDGLPKYGFRGLKIAVVDERSEIAGVYKGQPQNNIGVRTDVLDGCSKYDGIILLIRSMSPHIIVTDELGDERDGKAIHEALKAGVKIVSTVHGEDLEDLVTKPNLKELIKEKIFKRIIILDNSKGVGTIRDIIDGESFKSIMERERITDASIKDIR